MANSLDKFRKGVAQWSGNIGSAGISDAVVKTVPLASTSGLPTDTAVMITVNRVDTNGKKTGNYEGIVGVVSGSNLIDCIRGVEGTAQAWTGGTVVEVLHTASNINELIDGILAEHGQDGKHTKVNGNTVPSGTDTVALLAATQTLTNKTLTSPLFQGSVDGWISANETWTYASASTITVPSGAASKYQIGDKIKLTQTTVKYFYIVGVADTVLTVNGGSTVVADAAITANCYSHSDNPIGFPQGGLSYTPTISTTADCGTFSDVTFRLSNGRCFYKGIIIYAKDLDSGNLTITLPIANALDTVGIIGFAHYFDQGVADKRQFCDMSSNTTIFFPNIDSFSSTAPTAVNNSSWSSGDVLRWQCEYPYQL